MASQFPPLEPRFILPPESDEITDGIYIIGWRLVRDPNDPDSRIELGEQMNLSLSPGFEVASYPEIFPEGEGARAPVLVKPLITTLSIDIQPGGLFVSIAIANDNVYPLTLLITLKKVDH